MSDTIEKKNDFDIPARLLTPEEFIERASITLPAFYRLVREKQIPSVRFGRSIRILPDVAESVLRNGVGWGDRDV